MKPSIAARLAQLADRLDEVTGLLGEPSVTDDIDNYRKLTREHAELTPVVEQYLAFRQAESDIATARELLSDPDMRELAEAELADADARIDALERELQRLLLPKDPNDERNIFLEVRAGTGGDEAALFAADLFRMYSRYAERNRWQVEIVSASENDLGGYKEVIPALPVSVPTRG